MIYRDITQIPQSSFEAFQHNQKSGDMRLQGVCGFDGFIDHFIRMEQPDTMAEFGERLIAAAGVSASYTSSHLGEKFGGNGPLFATALHGIHGGDIDVHYIGALGKGRVLPIFEDALRAKMKSLHTLADPAHSDCLEFRDGKIMLGDLKSCTEICWDRMLECMGEETVDRLLTESDFIAAVNWGKLDRVGSIWGNMALRLKSLNVP